MICVECGAAVGDAYKEFSAGNIRLTRCDSCGCIADKYVEFETMLIIIDLILHKIQVYRHILFNSYSQDDEGFRRTVLKLIPAIVFFDTYLRWLRLHAVNMVSHDGYVTLFWVSAIELFVFVSAAVIAARLLHSGPIRYRHLMASIIISSFGKLLIVLIMIWETNSYYGPIVNLFVLSSNVTALRVSLNTPITKAVLIVATAYLTRLIVQIPLHSVDPSIMFTLL